ncbi:hypothetical protein ACIBEF_25195 [Micromonospora sp. NPDC050795]|uniref:hypothetical protein n=1 Tax=Micromonospora sp. NPDC050795 TaxID=3364282 RepID=UPI00379F0536
MPARSSRLDVVAQRRDLRPHCRDVRTRRRGRLVGGCGDALARGAGLDDPVEITSPAQGATTWSVVQVDNSWPVRRDAVAVDTATASVTARGDFASRPLLAQVNASAFRPTWEFFGPADQILLAALALGLLCVTIWGYRMWWQRPLPHACR